MFSDSLLLHVAEPREYDLVSGFGYAMGYLGGGLLFAINVAMTLRPAWFGLADAAQAVKASFVMVGLWWLIFALPLAFSVREQATGTRLAPSAAVRQGFGELARTLREIRRYRPHPLVSRRVLAVHRRRQHRHQDGGRLRPVARLRGGAALAALLLTQFVAFPAALAFGWLGQRIGARQRNLRGADGLCSRDLLCVFPEGRRATSTCSP